MFMLSSSLNYLGRLLLAALAPTIKVEFQLSNDGNIIFVFSIVCALARRFVDRVGLNAGITAAMSVWSLTGAATRFSSGLPAYCTMCASLAALPLAGIAVLKLSAR